ncbi:hypothetical protein Tcan_12716 [Toxocara canis]|uniref:EGF-like domain-containing protein n=1 Tax=Toxocara canis TaxID=6265 RepID=A0A0B2W2P6_TOXCA|nr:hypothetical protein Tcan_12716 [Toxocara canis]
MNGILLRIFGFEHVFQYQLSDFCNGQQCEEGSECTVRNGFTECVPHDALAFFSSCDDGLCLNGAQCVQVTADRYRCICAEGYQGIYCQLSDSTPFSTLSTATAIFLLGLLLLIALSALLICHSSNIGCYLVMPGEGSYARWDEEDEQNDDRIPLGIVKSDGLKASVTADTIVDLEGPSLQRTRETITL